MAVVWWREKSAMPSYSPTPQPHPLSVGQPHPPSPHPHPICPWVSHSLCLWVRRTFDKVHCWNWAGFSVFSITLICFTNYNFPLDWVGNQLREKCFREGLCGHLWEGFINSRTSSRMGNIFLQRSEEKTVHVTACLRFLLVSASIP